MNYSEDNEGSRGITKSKLIIPEAHESNINNYGLQSSRITTDQGQAIGQSWTSLINVSNSALIKEEINIVNRLI